MREARLVEIQHASGVSSLCMTEEAAEGLERAWIAYTWGRESHYSKESDPQRFFTMNNAFHYDTKRRFRFCIDMAEITTLTISTITQKGDGQWTTT